jgi:group I intron endonuclease
MFLTSIEHIYNKSNSMVIYETINKINGKRYIGKDKHNDPSYLGSGTLLNKAIKKYGKDNFIKTILEYCNSEEHMAECERHWIKLTNAQTSKLYYNIGEGGIGGDNYTHNPNQNIIREHIRQNRATHIETPHSESTKENQRKAAKGRYTLPWFKERYGDENGERLYEERRWKLKNRNYNKFRDPITGKFSKI